MAVTTPPALAAGTVALGGAQVPRMGYGTMGLGHAVQSGGVPHEAAVRLLEHAFDLGVTAYDTAEFYGAGAANEVLREALGSRREEVCWISKVGARSTTHGPMPVTAAQRPEELRAEVEANLRTLGTDHLDVVYLRRMDRLPGLIAVTPSQRVPLDDQLAELVHLRDAGTIGAIGLSHVSLDQARQALPAGIVAISNVHSVLNRTEEDVLHLADQHGLVWSPFFPLGGGGPAALHGRVSSNAVVQQVAREVGATPQQVGLAWLLARSPHTLVIAGTTSSTHLDENVAAAGVRLPDDALRRLDDLA